MEALQLQENGTLLMRTFPVPEITADDHVKIHVSYCGVCGTDLHMIKGDVKPFEKFYKTENCILGHEMSGIVCDMGQSVNDLRLGDRIVVDPNTQCGQCDFCHRGRPNHCQMYGKMVNRSNGGLAEYVVVSRSQVFCLPPELSLAEGVLCEPMSCVLHGWDLIAPIADDCSVLVLGAGIIGLLWSCMLHYRGYRRITVTEASTHRRDIVTNLDLGIQARGPLTPDEDVTFDVIIDCSGSVQAIEGAISHLTFGGTLLMFAMYPHASRLSLDVSIIQQKRKKYRLSIIDPFTYGRTVTIMDGMNKSKYINTDRLGIKVYTLKEQERAFSDLNNHLISKAIFKMSN